MNKTAGRKPERQRTATPAHSVQDRFLNQMIDEHKKVAVFLLSGVKLEGEIVSFDQYVILIKGAMTDTVYKHAVSTIQPIVEGGARDHGARDHGARTETARSTVISRRKPRLVRAPGGEN